MVQTNSTNVIVEQMDDLLENGDLSTKNGLRFAFAVLREAMGIIVRVERQVDETQKAYGQIAKTASEHTTRFETYSKKVDVMWVGFQVGIWVGSAIGVLIIGLIWSLITGTASITIAR